MPQFLSHPVLQERCGKEKRHRMRISTYKLSIGASGLCPLGVSTTYIIQDDHPLVGVDVGPPLEQISGSLRRV